MNSCGQLSTKQIRKFQGQVYENGRVYWRDMPWRCADTPYRLLVSEVMLQQTQVPRVIQRYPPFIQRFPDAESLAAASRAELLRMWSGLGYNRRALFLQEACRYVVEHYGGVFPADVQELQQLPGVGHATAAAVCNYAFAIPVPFLETNIRQVLIWHFFADRNGAIADRELLPIAAEVIDEAHPREWHWALMDYGTALKRQYGNLQRRSAAYTKQSRFEGSHRQKRSRVLQYVLASGRQSPRDIQVALDMPPDAVKQVVTELAKEGFVVREGDTIRIAE